MIKKSVAGVIILLFLLSSLIPITSSYSSYETNKVYSIHIDETGTLSGYVKDTSMSPIEGAIVRASCGENYFENVSDSSGYYYIDNIPIVFCLWNVSASKTGYKTIWVEMSIGENTTYDFVLMPLDKTLYVGGSGAGNYSKIQSAIDNASDGDKVYVFNGTYYENIVIVKTIDLIGEDRNITIIDGLNKGSVIHVKVESVSIENFTIRNGTNGVYDYNDKTSISHNIIINNDKGIKSSYSKNVNITGNIISENNYGITFYRVEDSIIKGNHILSNKEIGILFTLATMPGMGSNNNTVSYNIIQKNTLGVYLETVSYSYIINNNFYCNVINAFFVWPLTNYWDGNYWNRPRVLPKPIFGIFMAPILFVQFDWHPAKEPYDI